MYCRQCGFNNDNYTKICRRCGSSLADEPVAPKAPEPAAPGELRYASKSESFKEWLMIPFEKLNRARPDSTRRKAVYIAIIAVFAALIINIGVNIIRACTTVEEEDSYGNSGMNIVHETVACTDGEYVYYLVTSGDNTGIFREPVGGGEILKLTYLKLDTLSVYEGWLYGIDPFGIPYRVPCGGGAFEQLNNIAVSHLQIFNHHIYFTNQYSELMRIAIDTLGTADVSVAERITDRYVSSFLIDDAVVYFIEDPEPVKRPSTHIPVSGSDIASSSDVPDTVVSTSDGGLAPIPDAERTPETEKREWRIIKQWTDEDGAIQYIVSDYPETPAGPIWRMTPDGSDAEQLTYDDCSNICVWDGFLYYTTEKLTTVSASDVDHTAPKDILINRQVLQCWKLDLHTLKYSRFLDEGMTASSMLPCDTGFYFLSGEGNMLYYDNKTEAVSTVLTYIDPVRRVSFCGDWIYFVSYDGLTITRVKIGEVKPETVCSPK